MYRAVRQVIQKNNSSWSGFEAFENGVTKFVQKVTELERLTYQKSKALVGAKSQRDKKRAIIADKALIVANGIFSYASNIEDEKLKAEVNYSPSTLKYTPNTRFFQMVEGIIAKATELITEIEPYGVDQAKLDDLELAYTEMAEIANLPRQAIVSRKMISTKIDELIQDVDNVLKEQLDRLIVSLKADEKDFVLVYEGARTIIDSPASRRKLDLDDVNDKEGNTEFLEDQGDGSPPGDGPINS